MYQRTFIVILFFVTILNIVTSMPTPNETPNPDVMCKLPEARGNCRALLPRWRYDPAVKNCREFKFGGCAGNGNNFETFEACMKVCSGV